MLFIPRLITFVNFITLLESLLVSKICLGSASVLHFILHSCENPNAKVYTNHMRLNSWILPLYWIRKHQRGALKNVKVF
jgi:hypothetical protein